MQREFTLVMLAIMMTAAFIVGVTINFSLKGLFESAPPTISKMVLEQMVDNAKSHLVVSAILIIFVAVMTTGFFGIFFLHRAAGPVYRFRQVLKRIASGELPESVQLRRRDFFKETAVELNRAIDLFKNLENASAEVDDLVEELPMDELKPHLSSKIRKVQALLNKLKKTSQRLT
jgi:methyl-accepting chemotaxis protein